MPLCERVDACVLDQTIRVCHGGTDKCGNQLEIRFCLLVCLKFGEIGGIVDPHRDAIEADAIDAMNLLCWCFAP